MLDMDCDNVAAELARHGICLEGTCQGVRISGVISGHRRTYHLIDADDIDALEIAYEWLSEDNV